MRAADECGFEWRPKLVHARVAGLSGFPEAGNFIWISRLGPMGEKSEKHFKKRKC